MHDLEIVETKYLLKGFVQIDKLHKYNRFLANHESKIGAFSFITLSFFFPSSQMISRKFAHIKCRSYICELIKCNDGTGKSIGAPCSYCHYRDASESSEVLLSWRYVGGNTA